MKAIHYHPYTYRILFIPTGQEYYGVQHKKGAHPSNLFVNYFTSSIVVKKLIEEHGKEAFEIISTEVHASKEEALAFEEEFLISVDAARNTHWLNGHNGGHNFCSTEESSKQQAAKLKAYYAANPEMMKQREAKRKATEAANPEIMKQRTATRKANIAENPEIMKQWEAKRQATLSANPEIRKQQAATLKATHSENPEIRKQSEAKRQATHSENPEIRKQQAATLKATYAAHPEIIQQQVAAQKAAYAANPEIIKHQKATRKATLDANPEIIKQRTAKRKLTLEENPDIMKQVGEKFAKSYIIVFPDGIVKVIKNLRRFCRECFEESGIKLYHGALIKVANCKSNNHKGFKCSYYTEESIC